MKKDSYSQLFTDYKPHLSSAAGFMQQLNRSLDSVEVIKRQEAVMKRHRRIALAVAFITGLLTGVAGTLCVPHLVNLFSAFRLPEIQFLPQVSIPLMPLVLSWLVVGGASILLALQGYSAASAVMEGRD